MRILCLDIPATGVTPKKYAPHLTAEVVRHLAAKRPLSERYGADYSAFFWRASMGP